MRLRPVRVAVVGHVEWVEFARVEHVPLAGEIVHTDGSWQQPGGGGAVAAVQLAKLAGQATFFTALGDDELGQRSRAELEALGVSVRAAFLPVPQRRAFVHLDSAGERTITVIGDRLGPSGRDPLPWAELAQADAVYFTAGDAGAVRAARAARTLVAAARGLDVLAGVAVELDALVASGSDAGERYEAGDLDPPPRLIVRTAGAAGGVWEEPGGTSGRWEAAPLPGPVADAYGCGDSFAAGLTFGLGAGMPIDGAARLAARCGAACLTGRGPYESQLTVANG
ncbi:MAG: PfkB family carbohydrate kinase [Thermoleophilaceae bacterium]